METICFGKLVENQIKFFYSQNKGFASEMPKSRTELRDAIHVVISEKIAPTNKKVNSGRTPIQLLLWLLKHFFV